MPQRRTGTDAELYSAYSGIVAVYLYTDRHRPGFISDTGILGLAVSHASVGYAVSLLIVFRLRSVYRFTNNRIIYGAIIVLSLTACAFGMVCGTKAWIIKQ